jgi:cytochrome c553
MQAASPAGTVAPRHAAPTLLAFKHADGVRDRRTRPTAPTCRARQRSSADARSFNIHCAVCHGYTGQGGNVRASSRQRWPPLAGAIPNFHARSARTTASRNLDGEYFEVITNGFNTMPAYGARISVGGPLGDRPLRPRPPVPQQVKAPKN